MVTLGPYWNSSKLQFLFKYKVLSFERLHPSPLMEVSTSLKTVWSKICIRKKIWSEKKFWSKIFFWSKKFLCPRIIFGQNIFFYEKKKFCQKKIMAKKNCGSNKSFCPKDLLPPPKKWLQKKFGV